MFGFWVLSVVGSCGRSFLSEDFLPSCISSRRDRLLVLGLNGSNNGRIFRG
jgi:hypothetical protein